jgi:purine-nucleoside phosphorylase
VPARLRPTAPIAPDAVLVGDPGRALLLAQELLAEPKMSNHARGLWGYSGRTPAGDELTIQSTGMGGPSAAVVLADLAKLGVRRAVRVGTCAAVDPATVTGELLVVERAVAEGGSAAAFGVGAGEATSPDPGLTAGLERELGDGGRSVAIASFDAPGEHGSAPGEVAAADMQTATVLARGRSLGIAVAAVLIVERAVGGERIGDEALEGAARRAGQAAADVLST